jgi:hypothetical protein
MWKLQKNQYNRKRREIAEIVRWSRRQKNRENNSRKKAMNIFKKIFSQKFWRKNKTKFEKLMLWNFIQLNKKDRNLLKNRNFLNSQNYISSYSKKYKLFFYSKEKRTKLKKSKIMINKIQKDLFENFYINFLWLLWKNKIIHWYKIYLWNKFLYLIKI